MFGELRGPLNKSLDSGTNSEVLIKVLLNNNMVRLVTLGRVDSEVDIGISISTIELNLF